MPKRAKSPPGLRVVERPGTSMLWIRGTVRGRSVYESAGTDRPALAEEYRATREAELYRSAIHGEKPKVAFASAAQLYLTKGKKKSKKTIALVDRLIAYAGPAKTCDEIDQNWLDGAAAKLCQARSKGVTIHRNVTTPLTAVLTYASRRKWCDQPAFEQADDGSKRTDWITPAAAEALIRHAAPYLQPLITFLFCTGARVNEALGLEWRDVDLQHARCTFRGERNGEQATKNGRDRKVELPPRAVVALANLPGRQGRVFLHPAKTPTEIKFHRDGAIHLGRDGEVIGHFRKNGRQWDLQTGDEITTHPTLAKLRNAFRSAMAAQVTRPMMPYRLTQEEKTGGSGGQIRSGWGAARKKAGLGPEITPHIARHSWASWHYCVNKDLVLLREDGGWQKASECERYAKLVPNGYRKDITDFWDEQPPTNRDSYRLSTVIA